MIAKFPGVCAGCHKRFPAGATIHRAFGDAYICAGCFKPVAVPAGRSYADEVRDTLKQAKAVAAKAEAETKGGRR